MAGIYIHIPFCKSRCVYCGFFSSTQLPLRQRYVDALCREMQLRNHPDDTEPIETIYLGGGTPSLLSADQLRQLFIYINKVYGGRLQLKEVTIECNPDDVTADFAMLLQSLPVNRVSMGVQTFSNDRLRFLHRRHTAEQIPESVRLLRQAGIDNVSIDLMYGFPGETLLQWYRDIDCALALGIDHLSAYALQYEEGTALYTMLQDGRVEEIDEETERRMYYDLIDKVEAAGFEHYEISNFARPGCRSRHNSSYWNHTPYLGLGAAAHSFDGVVRQWNVDLLETYMQGVESGRMVVDSETLDGDTRYNDLVMTALRTCEGLSLSRLTPAQRDYCLAVARRYLDDHLLTLIDDRLSLTRKGLFVSDMVMADLMMVDSE